MKNIILISFIAISVTFAQPEYNFRKTYWGMCKDSVRASEESEPVADEESKLLYDNQAAGLDCYIGYMFVNDRLVRAKVIFKNIYDNKNQYIEDYDNVKEHLISNYGRPVLDTVSWTNNLYKDDPQNWGLALEGGDLKYMARWETLVTNIILALYGKDSKVVLQIQYDDYIYYGGD